MNIAIIGNGFDRAHNLKTSYGHFIDNIEKHSDIRETNLEPFYKWRDDNKYFNGPEKWVKDSTNNFYKRIVELSQENWCDIESLYFEELCKTEVPNKLNDEFEDVKLSLQRYLAIECKDSIKLPSFDNLFSRLSKPLIAINFNYTNTLNHYSEHFNDIINIHGQMDDSKNPIIFGYAASIDETFDLLKKNDNSYIKNIKQYEYLSTTNYGRIKTHLLEPALKNVLIFGHSCGLSDRMILRDILEDQKVLKIFNFYYNDMTNHKIKLININRTTNQETGFSKYSAFPKSLKMAQWDDKYSLKEIEEFIEKNQRYAL